MRVERELMRGAGPLAILKLLDGREMYGYELVVALGKQSNGVLGMGQSTAYPMLYNLEAKGYIKGHWKTMESGRQRKYYQLTDRGRAKLAADTKQWKALAHAMTNLGVLEQPAGAARGALA